MHDVPLNGPAVLAMAWRAAAGALPLWQSRLHNAVEPISRFAEIANALSEFTQAVPLADANPLGALHDVPAPEIGSVEEDPSAQEAERRSRWPTQRASERARSVVAHGSPDVRESIARSRLAKGATDMRRHVLNSRAIANGRVTVRHSNVALSQASRPDIASGTARMRRAPPAENHAIAPLASLERWSSRSHVATVRRGSDSVSDNDARAQTTRLSNKELGPDISADNVTSTHVPQPLSMLPARRQLTVRTASAVTTGNAPQGMSLVEQLVTQRAASDDDADTAQTRSARVGDEMSRTRALTRVLTHEVAQRAFATPVSGPSGQDLRFSQATSTDDAVRAATPANVGVRDLTQMFAPATRPEGLAEVFARALDWHEQPQMEDAISEPGVKRSRVRSRPVRALPVEQMMDAAHQRERLAESLATHGLSQSLPPHDEHDHNPELERLALDLPATTAMPEPQPIGPPAVHNTFNVTVHMEGGTEGGLNDDLAARLTRILVDQARRYGIDV